MNTPTIQYQNVMQKTLNVMINHTLLKQMSVDICAHPLVTRRATARSAYSRVRATALHAGGDCQEGGCGGPPRRQKGCENVERSDPPEGQEGGA